MERDSREQLFPLAEGAPERVMSALGDKSDGNPASAAFEPLRTSDVGIKIGQVGASRTNLCRTPRPTKCQ